MADSTIKKVCVIGAGTMGAGIAAQVANAGVPVLLLDIVPKDGVNRNAIAEGAVAKMLKTDPAPFMGKRAARLVETGNIEDHLGRVAECDWVVEAIIERLDIKQNLYAKLEEVRRPGTAVSSNTSTIPLAQLTDGRSDAFKQDFCITHFFNPPRYMRLIEIVAGPQSNPDTVAMVRDFVDRQLGKSVVNAEDSPGFIANRIGTFWIQAAVNAAFDLGLSVEEADEIAGRPMGVPKTGVFGLVDLVGIDLMPHLMASLTSTLPKDDPYQAIARSEPLIEAMIAEGYTGRKGKGGFYHMAKGADGARVKEAKDLKTGEYRPATSPANVRGSAARGDLKTLISAKGKVGDYAWAVLGPTLSYAASIVPEATKTVVGVDDAMKLGYNWKAGPFEMIDAIGAAHLVERLQAASLPVPDILKQIGEKTFYRIEGGKRQYFGTDGAYHDVTRPDGVLLLEDIKLTSQPLLKNGSAALWDVGEGVVALEFTGKMNALDEQVMKLIQQAISLVKSDYKALVVYNEGSNFSAGANLGLAMFALNIAAWSEVERLVKGGQDAYKALKYAPFPVVSAPFGMALGGGCEVCLNADAIQAHAETYIGLVETGVGLVPGWGGCGEMLTRWIENPRHPKGPMPAVSKAFEIISTATVAKSAHEAKELGFLRQSDGVTMNRDRLLFDARQRALAMVEGYAPPERPEYRLPGPTGAAALKLAVDSFRKQRIATPHDETVAGELAHILTGGDTDVTEVTTEAQLLKLEVESFMRLVRNPKSQARVEQMLETGKPLRN